MLYYLWIDILLTITDNEFLENSIINDYIRFTEIFAIKNFLIF